MVPDETNGGTVAARGDGSSGNVFAKIMLFFRQVIGELRKVVTPTRQELIRYTLVVLGFVLVMMGIVYGLDILFTMVARFLFGTPL